MSTKLTCQELDAIHGKIYSHTWCYMEPYVVRVVGWTKSKIIVEPVPLISQQYTAKVDIDWIKKNPINKVPLKKAPRKTNLTLLSVCKEDVKDNGQKEEEEGKEEEAAQKIGLITKGMYYGLRDLTQTFNWCDY